MTQCAAESSAVAQAAFAVHWQTLQLSFVAEEVGGDVDFLLQSLLLAEVQRLPLQRVQELTQELLLLLLRKVLLPVPLLERWVPLLLLLLPREVLLAVVLLAPMALLLLLLVQVLLDMLAAVQMHLVAIATALPEKSAGTTDVADTSAHCRPTLSCCPEHYRMLR